VPEAPEAPEVPEASGASGLGPDGKPSEAGVPLTIPESQMKFKLKNITHSNTASRNYHSVGWEVQMMVENKKTPCLQTRTREQDTSVNKAFSDGRTSRLKSKRLTSPLDFLLRALFL
jgi:hypothetical protein